MSKESTFTDALKIRKSEIKRKITKLRDEELMIEKLLKIHLPDEQLTIHNVSEEKIVHGDKLKPKQAVRKIFSEGEITCTSLVPSMIF